MENETRYSYQKKIKELEELNDRLSNQKYEFKQACSEIYEAIADLASKNSTAIDTGWILKRLRRCWM